MRRQAPLRWLATTVAVVTLGTFALSACGDDDNDTASGTTTTAAELTGTKAACQDWLKVEKTANEGPGGGDEQPTPEQGKAFVAKLQPVFARFAEHAPDELAATTADIQSRFTAAAANGDISNLDPSSDEAFGTELNKIEDWVHSDCGFQNLDVVAVDYEFQGMPATLKAGPTSISFMNHATDEFHELNIMRINDGAKMNVDEIEAAIHKDANAAEAQVGDQVTFVANTGAAPGKSSATTTTLTKGDYLVTCFVPVGGKDGAPPHAQMGMMQKFTVG